MIMVEGKITAWGTPHLPSCLEGLAMNTTQVKQAGVGFSPFPRQDYFCLVLSKVLGKCATLLLQQVDIELPLHAV